MLDKIFLQILNMSLTASYVILFVLLARLLLKKAPKVFSYALWIIVLFRFVCPFSFERDFGFIPSANPLTNAPPSNNAFATINNLGNANAAIGGAVRNEAAGLTLLNLLVVIWLIGITLLVIYSGVSFFRLRSKLVGAVKQRDNIYLADHVPSPFVIDILHPKIYLPSTLSEQEQNYIILHEQTHIQRFDHVVKIIAFIVLIVHWFNPLAWLAFILCVKDMEMSCDESVMKRMDNVDIRQEYAMSLLSLATGRKMIAGVPLAFGEGDTKSRIKNVLNYKKPVFWVGVGAFICVIVACVFLTISPNPYRPMEQLIREYFSIDQVSLSRVEVSTRQSTLEMNDPTQMQNLLDIIAKWETSRMESRPRDNNYDVNKLTFYDENSSEYRLAIYLNVDFSEVVVDNNMKASSIYEIKNPLLVKDYFDTLFSANNAPNGEAVPSDYKPAIMINDVVYWLSSEESLAELPTLASRFGQIKKVSPQNAPPDENFEVIGFDDSWVGKDFYIHADGNTIYIKGADEKFMQFIFVALVNVSEGELKTTALRLSNFEFVTNSETITVGISNAPNDVLIELYSSEDRELPIQSFTLSGTNPSNTFTNLTAARSYYLTAIGGNDTLITVSE